MNVKNVMAMIKTLIALFGGDVIKQGNVWCSNDLNIRTGQSQLAIGSFRLAAAASLLKADKNAIVLVQGDLADEIYPSLARVLCDELIVFGINKARIKLEEKSKK